MPQPPHVMTPGLFDHGLVHGLDHGLDLEQFARNAVARGADCVGMAGGHGSQALVASIVSRSGTIAAGIDGEALMNVARRRADHDEQEEQAA